MSETTASKKGGFLGGDKAVLLTKRFAAKNDYQCVAPLEVSSKQKEAKLDALVVGYFGILGVKTLDYDNGTIYGNATDEKWLWVDKKNNRSYFPNPILETAADVRVLRNALFSKRLQQTPIEVVCVFTSKKVQLAVPSGTGHYTLHEFKVLLRKEKFLKDVGTDLDKVMGAIQESARMF